MWDFLTWALFKSKILPTVAFLNAAWQVLTQSASCEENIRHRERYRRKLKEKARESNENIEDMFYLKILADLTKRTLFVKKRNWCESNISPYSISVNTNYDSSTSHHKAVQTKNVVPKKSRYSSQPTSPRFMWCIPKVWTCSAPRNCLK